MSFTAVNRSSPTGVVSATAFVVSEGKPITTAPQASFTNIPSNGLFITGWGISVDIGLGGTGTIGVIVDLILPRAGCQASEVYLSNQDEYWHPLVDPAKAIHLARGFKVFNAMKIPVGFLRADMEEWSGTVPERRVTNAIMVLHLTGAHTIPGLQANVRARGLLYFSNDG